MAGGSTKASGPLVKMADSSTKVSGPLVKPGDMIEISSKVGLFKHWALYMGENQVMFFLPLSLTKDIIKQGKLEDVVRSDKWRVNNYLDGKYVPRNIEVILEDARKMKDTEVPDNLFTSNCEHMVTNWRYGKLESRQVKPGALIEISRKNKPYKDWALCVAENEVIQIEELSPTKDIFKQEKLEKVVGSDQWCVNHSLDEIFDARDVQDILEDVQKLKDREVPYDLLTNTCERMVTNWRYGKPESHQVKPGALIEISRKNKPYKDWAMCVAENEVIHIEELSPTKDIFKQEKLEKVVGSDQWCVNHSLDEIFDARNIQDILEDVQKLKDREVPYDLFTNTLERMVTNWRYGKPESHQVKPGDMIEISRIDGLYKHWALYMGENQVMHLAPKSHSLTKAIVKQEKLENVVGTDPWRVNNSLDGKYVHKDIRDILEDAREMKDREVPYNLLTNNCEHMVTNWRYGKPESRQVQKSLNVLVSFVLFLVLPRGLLRKKRMEIGPVRRRGTDTGRWGRTTGPTEEGRETGLVVVMLLVMMLPMIIRLMAQSQKKPNEGFQRNTCEPTEEGGETVSEEEAIPLHPDTAAFIQVLSMLALPMLSVSMRLNAELRNMQRAEGFQRNTCEPTEEGGETVSEEEAIPLHPDTAEFPSMGHGSSTTGPTEESGEEDESESADGDLGCDLPIDKRFLRKIIIPTEKQGVKVDKEPGEMERREKDEQLMREPVQPEHLLHHE